MERLGRQNILPADIFNILREVDQVPSMYSMSKVGEELSITLKWKTDPRTPKMMSSEVNTLSAMKVEKKKTPSRIRRDKQRKQKWLEEREMRRAVPLSEETVDTSKLPVTEENSFSKINIRTDLPFQECENLADVIDLSATSKTELQLLQAKCHKLTKEAQRNEPLFTGELPLPAQSMNLDHILTYTAVGVTLTSLLTSAYLGYRLKIMSAAIFSFHKANAAPSFIFKYPSTPPTTSLPFSINDLISVEYIPTASAIIAIIVLVSLFVLIYICSRQGENVVSLEITTGRQCVTIPILALHTCPHDIKASGQPSNIIDHIQLATLPKVKIAWGNIALENSVSKFEYRLPTEVRVGLLKYFALKTMTKNLFDVHLGHITYLYNKHVSCPMCNLQ